MGLGKGVVNPVASILSAKLILEWLKEDEKAHLIDQAVTHTLAEEMVRIFDIGGRS